MRHLTILTLGLALAACGGETSDTAEANSAAANSAVADTAGSGAAAESITAALADPSGQSKGTATATQAGDAIVVRIAANGLGQGVHGAHVHTIGACAPPAFESAGPHWNPTDRKHGEQNPDGKHRGDLPNLTAAADGSGDVEYRVEGAQLAQMLDADGAAIVIHERADDYRTDPAGESGGRIACGVFERG